MARVATRRVRRSKNTLRAVLRSTDALRRFVRPPARDYARFEWHCGCLNRLGFACFHSASSSVVRGGALDRKGTPKASERRALGSAHACGSPGDGASAFDNAQGAYYGATLAQIAVTR